MTVQTRFSSNILLEVYGLKGGKLGDAGFEPVISTV
jgi:hypothetical protein